MKLLCLVNPWCRCGGVVEVTVEASGEVALETAADLSVCLAFSAASVCVGPGLGVMDHLKFHPAVGHLDTGTCEPRGSSARWEPRAT